MNAAANYRLHCFPESGNSYKLALLLTLSGQPWEGVWTDFFSGQTRDAQWRAEVNEMGEIPVLEYDGKRLTQSAVALLALADKLGRFQGRDDAEKQEVLRWLFWDNHKFTSYLATYRFLRTFVPNANADVLAFLRGRSDSAMAVAEKHLSQHDFMVGDAPTIADISMCGYVFYPAEETGYDFGASHPAIAAWMQRMASLPHWKAPYDLIPGPRAGQKG